MTGSIAAENVARRVARVVGALMDEGAGYDDALIVACASIPPGMQAELRVERTETAIDRLLEEIAEKDFAPRMPMAYDDWIDMVLAFCEGDDEDPIYPRLLDMVRWEDEPDRGAPFVFRDGIVERRAT